MKKKRLNHVRISMNIKVRIFWEDHKILQSLHCRFDIGQINGGGFAKFCGLVRIYEL